MRLTTFVTGPMKDTIADRSNYNHMLLFSDAQFEDGWEVWLQCQAFAKLPDCLNYRYRRGVEYRPNGKKCDFLIKKIDSEITLWVELKVQLKRNVPDLVKRFADDVNKIKNLGLDDQHNSLGAIAVCPRNGRELFTKQMRDAFKAWTDIDPAEVHFQAIEPDFSTETGKWSQSYAPDASRIIMLDYRKLS